MPRRRCFLRVCLVLIAATCNSGQVSTSERSPPEITVSFGSDTSLRLRRIDPGKYGLSYPIFYMQETEVTNRQFREFIRQTKRVKNDEEVLATIKREEEEIERTGIITTGGTIYSVEDPSSIWRNSSYPEGLDEHPVALVTLDDAAGFCAWLNQTHGHAGLFRLPTWNEWMVAAYGNNREYPWGNGWDSSKVHMSTAKKMTRSEPVKARPQGRSPEGLFGLYGNVEELLAPEDQLGSDYTDLGIRWMGGGFTEGPEDGKKAVLSPRLDYWGYAHSTESRISDLGFRIVLDTTKDKSLLSRKRLFDQRNKEWMAD